MKNIHPHEYPHIAGSIVEDDTTALEAMLERCTGGPAAGSISERLASCQNAIKEVEVYIAQSAGLNSSDLDLVHKKRVALQGGIWIGYQDEL